MRGYGRRTVALSFVVGLIGLAPTPAGAASEFGATFTPNPGCGGGPPPNLYTYIQTGSPNNQYTIPSPGVITSWSTQAGPIPFIAAKLKLARPASAGSATIVGESGLGTPINPNSVNSFLTRIPVQGGELLGLMVQFSSPVQQDCSYRSGPQHSAAIAAGDIPVGGPVPASPNLQIDVSAILEPDADNDGFGDETQDLCPSDASKQGECVPPDTTIVKGPKAKTKKKTTAFEFTSEGGATFACSLDSGPFEPCTSPYEVKVKKGKHTFAVRAVDAAGNVDATPATHDWKVKKRKK